jgi:uncharacterized protein (TIGR02246 family)
MRHQWLAFTGLFLILLCVQPVQGDERDEAVAAIRQAIESYVAAYNRGDAAAVAEHWAEDAEYVLPDGERVQGRDAIRKVFEEAFAGEARARIEVPSPSIRLLSETTAVEEGVARLLKPAAAPEETSYLAIHVKQSTGWKLNTVREIETPLAPASHASEHLQQLEWLVGEWTDAGGQAEVATTIKWSGKRAFLTYSFSAAPDELDPLEGTQVIGWDPIAGVIRSWLFDSDGGFGEGVWKHNGNRWVVAFQQTLPDGGHGRATNIYTIVDENTFTWSSIDRTINGEPIPDIDEVTIVRKTPQ